MNHSSPHPSARSRSVTLALIGLALLVPLAARAERPFSPHPWATCYAVKTSDPVTIDGDLSEWADIPGVKMAEEKFFFVGQGMSSAKWKGLRDLSATFKLQWDSEYLYIGVEVTDDVVTEPHGALVAGDESGSWDDDGIEIMLDTDGCGMPRYYVGDPLHHEMHFVYSASHPFVFDNFWIRQASASTPMFKLPDGSEEPLAYPGEAMKKNDITSSFSEPPFDGKFAFRRTDVGYNFEVRMKLPGATMKAINEGGHLIGFDITVNDNDEGKGPLKQQLHWSGVSDLYWRNCQFFGSLYLINK